MRRFVFILLWLLAAVLVLAATSPWWTPLALRVAGKQWGFTFERYERLGYSRFAVEGVRVARDNWAVTARRAEAPAAWTWLLHGITSGAGLVKGEDWVVDVKKNEQPSPPSNKPSGWVPLQTQLRRLVLAKILNHFPKVELTRGVVRWPGHELKFSRTTWQEEQLKTALVVDSWPSLDVTIVTHHGTQPWEVTARGPEDALTATAQVGIDTGEASLTLWKNPAAGTVKFDVTGWAPREARLAGTGWRLPADRLKMGAAYATVDGQFVADWKVSDFVASIDFSAEPKVKEAPPLTAKLRASGNPDLVKIDQLELAVPGITAALSAPVQLDRRGQLVSPHSTFTLEADLAQQSWVKAAGTLSGEVDVAKADEGAPRIDFRLSGNGVTWDDFASQSLRAEGVFTWPALEFRTLAIDFGQGDKLEVQGTADLRARTIGRAHVTGGIAGRMLAAWLPKTVQVASVAADIELSGPFAAVNHGGKARITGLLWRGGKPADVNATWQGDGIALTQAHIEGTRGSLNLTADGSTTKEALRLTAAKLTRDGADLWALDGPTSVTWRAPLQIEHAALSGPAGTVTANLSAEGGEITARLADLSLDWIGEVGLTAPPDAWKIRSVNLATHWVGDAEASVELEARTDYLLAEDRVVVAQLVARSAEGGLAVQQLSFTDGKQTFARASGRLPVSVHPGQPTWWQVDTDKPIAIEAVTEPYNEFWDRLAAVTGAKIINPVGKLSLQGTLAKPRGMLDVTADSASFDEAKTGVQWPAVEQLVVHATADDSGLQLSDLVFKVDGQEARVAGHLPMNRETWQQLAKSPSSLDWRQGDVKLQVDHARLAPFARYLPRFLAPQGFLTADFAMKPGGELVGRLEIAGAATRPIGSLGAVQEVAADIEFKGRRADFRRLTASIGGEPLALEGWVELPNAAPPRVNISLRGKNIPVARQPGLVVRSDLDLKAETPENGPTRLTGTLKLRDSLYVANLRSLVPGEKQAGPARPPPYFSVEPAPLNTWQLDVKLTGDRFLRVRTPLFRGMVSAQFKLGGTLGEPTAVGEGRIDEGTVLFPFAGFAVDHGRVTITPDRPREPQLNINGSSLRYGYDLRMELSGTANRPNLVFTSRPTLTSEQILLLVMAGEPPTSQTLIATENSNQQRYAQLGAYLGRNLFTTFGGDSEAADRLTITTGERLSRQGQETLEVEYEMGHRWSLVGEYDEYDDYNVGVKYKVLRRKPSAIDEK